jgi:hypothetical protein
MLTLSFSHCLFLHITVARYSHTTVVLPDGSVLVMGGYDAGNGWKNDIWTTVDGGGTWILVTSSAGWTGRKSMQLSSSLHILPPLRRRDARVDATARLVYSVSRFSFTDVRNSPSHDNLGPQISRCADKSFLLPDEACLVFLSLPLHSHSLIPTLE